MSVSDGIKRKRAIVCGMSLLVGMLMAGVTGAFGSGSQQPAGTCSDLAKAMMKADNVEFSTVYDPEHNIITVNGGGRTFTFDPRNKACRASSRLVDGAVSGALQSWSHTLTGTCKSMRDSVASGITVVAGRHVNLNAGRKFISEWCSGK